MVRTGGVINLLDIPHLTSPYSSSDDHIGVITSIWGKFLAKCSPGEQRLLEHLRNSKLLEITTKDNAKHVIEWLKVDLSLVFALCSLFSSHLCYVCQRDPQPHLVQDVLSTWENLALTQWGLPIVPIVPVKVSKRSRIKQGFRDIFNKSTS
jgi:hypothetical protein